MVDCCPPSLPPKPKKVEHAGQLADTARPTGLFRSVGFDGPLTTVAVRWFLLSKHSAFAYPLPVLQLLLQYYFQFLWKDGTTCKLALVKLLVLLQRTTYTRETHHNFVFILVQRGRMVPLPPGCEQDIALSDEIPKEYDEDFEAWEGMHAILDAMFDLVFFPPPLCPPNQKHNLA